VCFYSKFNPNVMFPVQKTDGEESVLKNCIRKCIFLIIWKNIYVATFILFFFFIIPLWFKYLIYRIRTVYRLQNMATFVWHRTPTTTGDNRHTFVRFRRHVGVPVERRNRFHAQVQKVYKRYIKVQWRNICVLMTQYNTHIIRPFIRPHRRSVLYAETAAATDRRYCGERPIGNFAETSSAVFFSAAISVSDRRAWVIIIFVFRTNVEDISDFGYSMFTGLKSRENDDDDDATWKNAKRY